MFEQEDHSASMHYCCNTNCKRIRSNIRPKNRSGISKNRLQNKYWIRHVFKSIFSRFGDRFWTIFWSKIVSQRREQMPWTPDSRPRGSKRLPRGYQDALKRLPRTPKSSSRGSQEAPKGLPTRSQEGFGRLFQAPERVQTAFETPPNDLWTDFALLLQSSLFTIDFT